MDPFFALYQHSGQDGTVKMCEIKGAALSIQSFLTFGTRARHQHHLKSSHYLHRPPCAEKDNKNVEVLSCWRGRQAKCPPLNVPKDSRTVVGKQNPNLRQCQGQTPKIHSATAGCKRRGAHPTATTNAIHVQYRSTPTEHDFLLYNTSP